MTRGRIIPYKLNLRGTIQKRTVTKSSQGQGVEGWANIYTDVYMKRIPPLKGKEQEEGKQNIGVQSDSFILRKEDRTINPADYRIVLDSEYYYITSKRQWKDTLDYWVLDTEVRDNEVVDNTNYVLAIALSQANYDAIGSGRPDYVYYLIDDTL